LPGLQAFPSHLHGAPEVTWTAFWILSGIIAAVELGFMTWWDMKKDKGESLSLQELLVGIGLAVCPVINTLVSVGVGIYMFSEVFPKIVLFGPKKP
jgi:hypothetical protein